MSLHPFGWLQKSERHCIELKPEQAMLLRRAAELAGESLSDFLLHSACKAAELALLDQRHFRVSGAQRQQMIALQNRPAARSAALARLLQQAPPWQPPGAIGAPQRLAAHHAIYQFDCGRPAMNDWLAHRALQAQTKGTASTFVVTAQEQVAGYFSMSVGQVDAFDYFGQRQGVVVDREAFPVPVAILTRLAVDNRHQHQGLGHALLREAILHVLSISEQAGVEALLTQPLDETVAHFYLRCGFSPSPSAYKQLLLSVRSMRAALAEPGTSAPPP